MTSPEKPQLPHDAEPPKRPLDVLGDALAAAEAERRKEQKEYMNDLTHALSWIGSMLSRHAVGKEPGRHLDRRSPISDLIKFGERDVDDEIKRHNYEEGNKISEMISLLKNEKFMPPEQKYVGQLYDALRAQLDENEKNLKKIRAQEHP